MIRRRRVYPDETGVVSRDVLLDAMVECATFLDFAGGVLSVVTERAPTGLPGEMVTVGAIVEWRHDARVQPRPEQYEQPTPAAARPAEVEAADPQTPSEEGDGQSEMIDPSDGFDFSKVEAEEIEDPVRS